MVAPSLLIFDLDGTLIDSRKDIANAVNFTFHTLGLPQKDPELIYGYVGNGVRRLIIDSLDSDAPDLVSRALKIFERHYLIHLLNETTLYPGIRALMTRLKNKKKAIATNKPIHYTRPILEGLNIYHQFDSIQAAEMNAPLKPHPGMILTVLNDLQVPRDKTVMIGDSQNDIEAASAAGVLSCAVGYGLCDATELRLAHPDFFAETVEEIGQLFV